MKFRLISLINLLIIYSCRVDDRDIFNESYLIEKNFEVILQSDDGLDLDYYTISFKDSVFQIIDYDGNKTRSQTEIPKWEIRDFQKSTFLKLENNVIATEKVNDSSFEGTSLSHKNHNYIFTIKNVDWTREMIYGKWVDTTYYNQPESIFPPPPDPIPTKYDWPPYYEITKDSIISNHYLKSKSKIDYSLDNEWLWMNLNHSFTGNIKNWRIESLNDSVMVVYQTLNPEIISNYPCASATERYVLIKMRE